MSPAQRTFAQSVFWLHSQGKTFTEIALASWENYAQLYRGKGVERQVADIRKARDQDEKNKIILHWLKGVVDNVLLNVAKMGLQEEFLNGQVNLTQGRCMELRRAWKADGEKRGPEFTAAMAKFVREDTGVPEPPPVKKRVQIQMDCRVGTITFGGKQFYNAKRGEDFIYDTVVESNAYYIVTQTGLNLYVFPAPCVSV